MNDRKPASEYGQRKFEKGFAKKREGLQGVKNTLRKFWYDGSFARCLLMLPVFFLLFLLNPATIMMIIPYFYEDPPEPEIKYAEFPFTLVYEVRGEQKSISDVIVCEYEGIEIVGEAGKYRRWSSYIKSTGDEWLPILDLRSRNEVSEFGGKMLELYFYYGRPEYYMGDTDYRLDGSPQDFSYFNYTATDSDGEIRRDNYSDFEAMVKYDIRFISWECAPPIENSFSE